jgi:DNA-binding transcriptional LysR family regulator
MRVLIAHSDLLGVIPRSVAQLGLAARELALLKTNATVEFAPISLIARKEIEPSPLIRHIAQTVKESTISLGLV